MTSHSAVASVLSSIDVVYLVQPTLVDSTPVGQYIDRKTEQEPVIIVRENNDPLADICSTSSTSPIGVSISVESLFSGIPHFCSLKRAGESVAIVFHAAVGQTTDFGLISAIRQAGFVIIYSKSETTLKTAQQAYGVALSQKKPVIHLYEADSGAVGELVPNAIPDWTATLDDLTAFEYSGETNAESVIAVLGSSVSTSLLRSAGASVVYINVVEPFDAQGLVSVIPSSVQRIAFAEQTYIQPTTFGHLVSEFVLQAQDLSKYSAVVGTQLGKVTATSAKTVAKAIIGNLESEAPVQSIFVGEPQQATTSETESIAATIAAAKSLELPYIRVLNQLFGDNLNVINAAHRTDAGVGSVEYGFGEYLGSTKEKIQALERIRQLSKNTVDSSDAVSFLASPQFNHPLLNSEAFKQFKAKFASQWLIGSDAWAYDLGASGVHHVVSSGENINMLIVDSEPFSTKKSSKAKKDVGLYAMNFGNVYVASVAVYASYTQLLEALLEAEKFDGPSVVVAYLPYHEETNDALVVLQETKKAVESGYWPLYRYNPSKANDADKFSLDSFHLRQSLREFLDRENKLSLLSKKLPQFSRSIESSYGDKVKKLQKQRSQAAYQRLLEGLGPGLSVLFASDGGQAESVAKRLTKRANARGLVANVCAFDDFSIDEVPQTENIVFITSTAGQGEFPQNGRQLWEQIKGATDIDLSSTKFSVFGMGDSEYWPRKQDKIYYNKPARDLFNKLVSLGGVELVPLGLGDDQDADGWSTEYKPWEEQLWQALNVSGVAVEEEKVITNEDIKLASNYLRGTIAEGLKDQSTGAISAHDQQLTKFHGIYMQDDRDVRDARKEDGLEPAYAFMVRVRLPGCVATPDQWLRIHDLSDKRGNGTFKITTRGTFQLHGVIKEDLKPAIRGMNAALIDTLGACGDVNRNVVGPGLTTNAKIHKDITQVCDRISEHLLPETTAYHEIWLEGADSGDSPDFEQTFASREKGPNTPAKKKKKKELVSSSALVDKEKDSEPLYGDVYLPRKFKISVAVPPYNDVDVYAHDIGLVTIVDDETNSIVGFNVLVGGGMGVTHNNKKTYPRTGSLLGFVPVEFPIEKVCESVMLVQRDHGDRTNRKHARLKYTVDDLGVDQFRAFVEERMGHQFEAARPFEFVSNTDQFGWSEDETGKHHFTTFVENGRVENTPELQFKEGLKQIALQLKTWGTGEFRLTANQHIIISDIEDHQLEDVKQLLAKYKLDNVAHTGLRLSSAACVAFPTCGLAMAESERYLPVLISKLEDALEEYGLRHDSIVMRMTGCPNGCARPWLAEVALVGKAYGAYNLLLGGGFHGQRLNKLYRSSIKEDEILAILKPLFKRWALERQESEPFGDFLIRVGVIAETTEGKAFWEHVNEE